MCQRDIRSDLRNKIYGYPGSIPPEGLSGRADDLQWTLSLGTNSLNQKTPHVCHPILLFLFFLVLQLLESDSSFNRVQKKRN